MSFTDGTAVEPLSPAQQDLLSRWRAMALQRMPYFAPMLFEVRPLNAPGLGTFAVDKHYRLYIDFDAVAPHGDLWCAEALLHEAGHLWCQHADRGVDAGLINPDGTVKSQQHGMVSNLAGDAEINDDLVVAGCTTIGSDGVTPGTLGLPDFETYEFYVKQLLRKMPPPPPAGGGGGAGGNGQQAGQGNGFGGFSTSGCGSGAGNAPRAHELPGHNDLGGAAPAATDADKDRATMATANAIVETQKARGTVPAGLVAQAEQKLAPPQVPWQKVLAASLRAASRTRPGDTDQTWRKRNRRRHNVTLGSGGRVVYPGSETPVPRIVAVRDTSGSMSQKDLDTVTSEIVGIAKQLGIRGDELMILDVDADVAHEGGFSSAKALATVHGRGGTDMCVGIERAAQMNPRPHACVVLTDGYTPWPVARPRGMAVIACIVGAGNVDQIAGTVPSWIRTVKVQHQK